MKKLLILFAGILFLASCKNGSIEKNIVEIQGIDSTLSPGDNFFQYANRIWMDSAQIPPSQAGVGAYMFMNYPQRLRLQGILDSVSKADNAAGSIAQKIGDFYASGMDTATINQLGYDPVKPILANVDAISDINSLMKYVAEQAKNYNSSVLGLYVSPGNKNSNLNIAHVYQTGIALPERDYYFKTDAPSLAIQQAYKDYLSSLFQLTGTDSVTAKKDADVVYNIDKQLAASHKTNIELRDVNANFNMMSVADLAKRQPNIGWENVLNNMGVKTDSIDVAQPAYYDKLNTVLKTIPVSDWKVYLKASVLNNYADALSKPFADAEFGFNKVISGQAVHKPVVKKWRT